MQKYLIMWAKDKTGTEGHPLCRKGVVVAKAKAAAEADKPKDMTPKADKNIKTNRTALPLGIRGGQRQGQEEAPQALQQRENASSPILSRGHRTRAASIVLWSRCVPDLALPRWNRKQLLSLHCKGMLGVCKGAGLGRPIKLYKH
jgi:hypothetical protein